MSELFYLSADDIVGIHSKTIRASGGLDGFINRDQIYSIVEHMQNDDYYPEFEDKISHLVFCLVKFHMFSDGNKRTAVTAAQQFLDRNGLFNFIDDYYNKMEIIVVAVADGRISKENLKEVMSSLIFGDFYPEMFGLDLESCQKDEFDYAD